MVFCPECGAENPDKSKYCSECGATLDKDVEYPSSIKDKPTLMRCKDCKGTVSRDASTCPHCGARLKNPYKKALPTVATIIIILIIGIITIQHMEVVTSDSMQPVLYRGDIVIKDSTPSTVQVDDIIQYKPVWVNIPVIHRVIKIGHDQSGNVVMLTKGDNNPSPDPALVYSNQIVSKVVSINGTPLVIPKIGYFYLWITGT